MKIRLLRDLLETGERGGSVVECRTPEREVRGSRPTAAVLCPWARHFTPRKYWLITQEAMAPPRHDWKIVDWDVKPQHNQPTNQPLRGQWNLWMAISIAASLLCILVTDLVLRPIGDIVVTSIKPFWDLWDFFAIVTFCEQSDHSAVPLSMWPGFLCL